MIKKLAKPGRKSIDRARKKISRSIAMRPDQWDQLDKARGKQARGAFIAEKLNQNKPCQNTN
jgi:hypothetical protein